MKNNLLKEEILRIKEIMGVSLIIESKLPSSIFQDLTAIFLKNDDDALEAALKSGGDTSVAGLTKSISDTASTLGKQSDEIIAGLRSGNLADNVAEELFVNVLKGADNELKSVFLKNIDKNISDIFNIAADGTKKVATISGDKTLNELSELNSLDGWVRNQKQIIDDSSFSDSLKTQMKNKLDDDILKIKSASPPKIEVPKTMGEFYNLLSIKATALGKTMPSKTKVNQISKELATTYKTAEDAWKALDEYLGKNKDVEEQIKKGFGIANTFAGGIREFMGTVFGKVSFTFAALTIAYTIYCLYGMSENEADEYIKRATGDCGKLQGAIRKAKIIGGAFPDLQQNYKIQVMYDGKIKDVIEVDDTLYIKLDDDDKIELSCNDTKLADKKFDSSTGVVTSNDEDGTNSSSSEGVTTAQIIAAIKKEGYIEPITLSPNENNKTNYTYVDADGTDGTVTVDNNGNIIVK